MHTLTARKKGMQMIVNFMLSSPLSHGTYDSRPGGNYSAFRRIPIISGDKVLSLPMVSGNAIRGVMRRSAMQSYQTIG